MRGRLRNSSRMISNHSSLTSSTLVKKRWPPRSKRYPPRVSVLAMPPVTTRRLLLALATSEAFEKAVSLAPGARARAWRSARRYFAGETADDALRVAGMLAQHGLRASLDLFGERVADRAIAARVTDDYVRLAARLPA